MKQNYKTSIIFLILLVCCFKLWAGTTYYWNPAGTSHSWFSVGNWRISSCGGTVSTAHPGSADTVIFDGGCSSSNCTLDGGYTVAKIWVKSSYSGTLSMQNGNGFTATVMLLDGGTFTGSTGGITVNAQLTINGCSFTASSGTTTVKGKFEFLSGSFTNNSGLFIMTRTSGVSSVTMRGTAGSSISFYKLDLATQSAVSAITLDSLQVTVTDTFWWHGAGQLTVNTNNAAQAWIEVQKNVVIQNSHSSSGGNIELKFTGTNNQKIISTVSSGGGLPKVVIGKSSGSLTLSGTITEANYWLNNYSGTVDAGTSTVIFYGNQNLIIGGSYATTFYNLKLGGSSTSTDSISVSNGTTVSHTLSMQGSGNLTVKGGAITQQGDIDFSNSSSSTTLSSDIILSGSNSQALSGSGTFKPATMTINKSASHFTLNAAMTLRTSLTLTKGRIITTSTYLLNLADNATVSGGSDSSYVSGPMKKTGNDAFTYPTGKNGEYHSIYITAPGSTTDAFTAEYFDTTSAVIGTGKDTSMTHINSCGYWNLTRTTGSSNVKVQLNWNSHDCMVHVLSIMRIARWNSSNSKWENIGSTTTSGNATTGSIQSSSNQSSFGYFTLGKRSPAVYAHAGLDSTICYNSTITLGASPTGNGGVSTLSYSWSPTTGLSSSTAANPTWTTTDTVEFILTVTDADYKTAKDTVWVYTPAPVAADAGSDRMYCYGLGGNVGGTFTGSGGIYPYAYAWLDENDDTFSMAPIPGVAADSSKELYLEVTDAMGCVARDTIVITVDSLIEVDAGTDADITVGTPTGLVGTVSGGKEPYLSHWIPEDGLDDAGILEPTTDGMASRYYRLEITDSLGCHGFDEVNVEVGMPPSDNSSLFALLTEDSIQISYSTSVTGSSGARVYLNSSIVSSSGGNYVNTGAVPDAMTEMENFITTMSNLGAEEIGSDLNGGELEPGYYHISGAAQLQDTIRFVDGDSSAVYLLLVDDTIGIADGTVLLVEGCSVARVFMVAGGLVHSYGNVLLKGSVYSADRIIGDTITGPVCLKAEGEIHINQGLGLVAMPDIIIKPVSVKFTLGEARDLSDDAYTPTDTYNWFGLNLENSTSADNDNNNFDGGWNGYQLRTLIQTYHTSTVRLPFGGHAQHFDWNAGKFYDESFEFYHFHNYYEDGGNNLLLQLNDPDAGFEGLKKEGDHIITTLYNIQTTHFLWDTKFLLHGNSADLMWVMNMFEPEDYALSALDKLNALQLAPKYVELGNELYLTGDKWSNLKYKSAVDYREACNNYLPDVHSAVSGVRVGVVAGTYSIDNNEADEEDVANCRRQTWNAAMGLPGLGGTGELNLDPGDALIFHVYPSSTLQYGQDTNNPIPQIESVPSFMAYPFAMMKQLEENEFLSVPDRINIWVTEYNLSDKTFDMAGTWAQGLFTAALTLAFLEEPRITNITLHSLDGDAFHDLYFNNANGFTCRGIHQDITDGIYTIGTDPWKKTALGDAMQLVGQAIDGSHTAKPIQVTNSTPISYDGATNYPSVYGWVFDGAEINDLQQVVILNLGGTAKAFSMVMLDNTLGITTNTVWAYEQVSPPNIQSGTCSLSTSGVLGYVTGDLNMQFIDKNDGHVLGEGDCPSWINPNNIPKLVHNSLQHAGEHVVLPAYSITRIYMLAPEENYIKVTENNNSGESKGCVGTHYYALDTNLPAPDPHPVLPTGVYDAISLKAAGGQYYSWEGDAGTHFTGANGYVTTSNSETIMGTNANNNSSVSVWFDDDDPHTVALHAWVDGTTYDITLDPSISGTAGPVNPNAAGTITFTPTATTTDLLGTLCGTCQSWFSPAQGLYYTNSPNDPADIGFDDASGHLYAAPLITTRYASVVVDDNNGCFEVEEVKAKPDKNADIVYSGASINTISTCAGDNAILSFTLDGQVTDALWHYYYPETASGGTAYHETDLNGGMVSTTVTLNVAHNGYLIASDEDQKYFAYLKVNADPTLTLDIPKPEMCDDETMKITVSGAEGIDALTHDPTDGIYEWYIDDPDLVIPGDYSQNDWFTGGNEKLEIDGASATGTYNFQVHGEIDPDAEDCPGASSEDISFQLNVVSGVAGLDILDGSSSSVINSTINTCRDCDVSLTAYLSTMNCGSFDAYYSWEPGTGLNTTSSPTVIANPLFTTTYTVHVVTYGCSDYGCCGSATVILDVDPNCYCTPRMANPNGDAGNMTPNSLQVQPNPNTGQWQFVYYNNSRKQEQVTIQLFSMMGILMYEGVRKAEGPKLLGTITAPQQISNGTYLMVVSSSEGVLQSKIVIER